MDRRAALKRLAAGGAIAAGGSLVVSSTAVAQAASGPLPVGVPGSGDPLPVGVDTTTGAFGLLSSVTLTAPSFECESPAGLTTTYGWSIDQYFLGTLLPGSASLRLVSGAVTLVGGPGSTCGPGCTGPGFTPTPSGAATLTRLSFGGPTVFRTGDWAVIDLHITWQCSGGPVITATYRYDSRNGLNSDMQNLTYTIA